MVGVARPILKVTMQSDLNDILINTLCSNNAGPHVRQTFLNDVFTFLTEVRNAGRVVNTGTSSVNSEFVTTLIYVIFYLFLVNIIGNRHENKYI
jgi:hypothetical protein